MSWVNYADVLGQLVDASFVVDKLVVGKRQRVKVSGVRQKGWYQCHEITLDAGESAIVGSYGWWIGGEAFIHKFSLNLSGRKKATLTAEQKSALKSRYDADRKIAEAERAREIEAAAQKAAGWWRKLNDAGESGYLKKKGFQAGKLFGARISPSGNLAVPVLDCAGKIYGLQVIFPRKTAKGRDKDFTPPGLGKKGNFYQMGIVVRGGILLLCEGFATGASLHEATGFPVVVAFDAGNLIHVAQKLAKFHKNAVKILICADDDHVSENKTGRNTGKTAAEAAAMAVSGAYCWPEFPGERRERDTDFNDLHTHPDGGLPIVAAQIQRAIDAAGWAVQVRAVAPAGGGAGDGVTGRRRAEAIMQLDALVERFIPVDDGTGNYVFDLWTKKIVLTSQMAALSPAGVEKRDIKSHPLWISRGAYFIDEIGFDPSGKDPSVKLNTWRGWKMQPVAGKCELMVDLLSYLCSLEVEKSSELTHYLTSWLAWPLQHPGAKMGTAIIMHGPQGVGKSMIFQAMAEIYGDYASVLNQRALEDRFNGDWVDSKLYVVAEEIVSRADAWNIKNELKEIITGKWVRVNPKHLAAYRQRNQINMVMLSNENLPGVLEMDDRRHCVIYTPPMLSAEFYEKVALEMDSGGIAAFYHYLLNYDTRDFHPKKRPPFTEAKQELIDLSAPSEARFARDWLSGDIGLPVCPVRTNFLYRAYEKWCRESGERFPRSRDQFINAMGRLDSRWEKKKVRAYSDPAYTGSDSPVAYLFPPAESFSPKMRYVEGKNKSVWLTDCAFEFLNALQEGKS